MVEFLVIRTAPAPRTARARVHRPSREIRLGQNTMLAKASIGGGLRLLDMPDDSTLAAMLSLAYGKAIGPEDTAIRSLKAAAHDLRLGWYDRAENELSTPRLGDLSEDGARCLAEGAAMLKAGMPPETVLARWGLSNTLRKYSPDEARDERGRWTNGGDAGNRVAENLVGGVPGQPKTMSDANSAAAPAPASTQPLSYDKVRALIAANNKSGQSDNLITAIAYQESRFNPNAQNGHSSAAGLLGVTGRAMKDLQNKYGVYSNTDLYNPAQNIDAGSKYLGLRIYRAHGNIDRALAGYGDGPAYATRVTAAANALGNNPKNPMQILKQYIGK